MIGFTPRLLLSCCLIVNAIIIISRPCAVDEAFYDRLTVDLSRPKWPLKLSGPLKDSISYLKGLSSHNISLEST